MEDDENDDEGEGAAATKIVQCDDDVEDMSGCEDGGDCGDDDAGRTAAEAAAILTDGRYMCVERYSQQTQAVACGDHVLCKLRSGWVFGEVASRCGGDGGFTSFSGKKIMRNFKVSL